MNRGSHKSSGFTILEVVIALAIILALAAVVLVSTKGIRSKAQATTCVSRLRQVGAAIHLYAAEHNNTLPGPLTSQSFFPVYRDEPGDDAGSNGLFYHIWSYLGLSSTGTKARLARVGVCPAAEPGKSEGYLINSKFFTTNVHSSNSKPGIAYPNRNELPPESATFGRSYPLGYRSTLHGINLMPWKVAAVPSPGKFALLGELPGNVKNTIRYHSTEYPPDPDMHCNFLFLDGHVETHSQRSVGSVP